MWIAFKKFRPNASYQTLWTHDPHRFPPRLRAARFWVVDLFVSNRIPGGVQVDVNTGYLLPEVQWRNATRICRRH